MASASWFCPTCHGLMQRREVRGVVVSVCPKCSPAGKQTAWWNRDAGSAKRDTIGNAARVAASDAFMAPTTPPSRRERAERSEKSENAKPREPREPSKPAVVEVPKGAEFFPYGTVRDGQREFLADVADAAANRRILVANAPTGLGKTVSSLAPLVRYALENKKRVFFLTSKQSQHKIAIETLRAIKTKAGVPIVVSDLISKQDMCPRREAREMFSNRFAEFCHRQVVHKECEYFENDNKGALAILKAKIHHVDETTLLGADCIVCPHQTALDLGQQAHVVVCDFNYFFSDMRDVVAARLSFDVSDVLLVVDEAHNLPDRIRDHLTLELNEFVLNDASAELSDIDDERLRRIVESLKDLVADLAEPIAAAAGERVDADEATPPEFARRAREGERLVSREEFALRMNKHLSRGVASLTVSDYDSLLEDLGEAMSKHVEKFTVDPRGLMKLHAFLVNWKRERPGLARVWTRDPDPVLKYIMLDPSLLSRGVFETVHAAVLMSGTLHPGEMYRDVLGLPAERTVVRYYRSPFPPENKLVLVDAGVTTSYQERGADMSERIAKGLVEIAEATPGNVAAFFPSYAILESVRPYLDLDLRSKELVVETRELAKSEKEGLVDTVRRTPQGALLCGVQGGSLSEGYDYEDNLLKAVVIVGLPFAVPTLEVQALIDFYTKKFGARGRDYAYVFPTLNRVLQAAGRMIRSPDDRGVIVLMDKRFNWSSYRAAYPVDFSPRVASDVSAEVKRFWR